MSIFLDETSLQRSSTHHHDRRERRNSYQVQLCCFPLHQRLCIKHLREALQHQTPRLLSQTCLCVTRCHIIIISPTGNCVLGQPVGNVLAQFLVSLVQKLGPANHEDANSIDATDSFSSRAYSIDLRSLPSCVVFSQGQNFPRLTVPFIAETGPPQYRRP